MDLEKNDFLIFDENLPEEVWDDVPVSRDVVVEKISEQVYWWLGEREKKLKMMDHDNMSLNPMLMPIIMELHGMNTPNEMAKFSIASHLMQSYSTGYGKLVDEKILPNVFGTKKLTAKFRRGEGAAYSSACFDEIDHLISRKQGVDLLSLKASKWTIQLTASVQLNSSFTEIKKLSDSNKVKVNKIYVGVFYGKKNNLTDKYDILRGINRGANHDVTDLQDFVDVKSGKEFWTWINRGEENTQDWIAMGQQAGVERFKKARGSNYIDLLKNYEDDFVSQSAHFLDDCGKISSEKMLKQING